MNALEPANPEATTAAITKNPLRETGYVAPSPPAEVGAFHRRMPAYAPTNLFYSPDQARQL